MADGRTVGRTSEQRVCVMVLGMHRSGTSAMTRSVNAMGAALPSNLIPPMEDNAEGFWESEDIVRIHDRFMVAVGSAWNDPRLIPPAAFDTPAAAACGQELRSVLRRDMTEQRIFVLKDPRMSVLMPIWRPLLDDLGVRPCAVLGFRHPDEVAQSLIKRRHGFVDEANLPVANHARATWLTYNLEAERSTRDIPRVVVAYGDFLEDPVGAARRLADRLGCFNAEHVAVGLELVREQWKPQMRNHAAPVVDLPPWVGRMYRWLCDAAADAEPSTAPLDALAKVMEEANVLYGPLIAAGRPSPRIFKAPVTTRISRRLGRLAGQGSSRPATLKSS
jgi:hypothetical protein